jgi:hypothetical protein
MAKKKYVAKNRITGIFFDDKKGPSTHEAGATVEIEEKDAEALVKCGALELIDSSPEVTEHHRAFLKSRGYKVETIEDAQAFVDRLHPKEREGFMADAEGWVNLDAMTKAQLVEYAQTTYSLALSVDSKKDELIEAIEDARLKALEAASK